MFDVLLMLAAAASGQAADPLAPAKAGKIQCIAPNAEKKTCMGIASYKARADGGYDRVLTAVIGPDPLITMETHSIYKIEGDAVCGIVRKEDFEASVFTMNGNAVDENTANMIRGQVLAAVAPMVGKNGCARNKADGDVMFAEVTLDGVARPELSQKFIWVKPEDGYKLG